MSERYKLPAGGDVPPETAALRPYSERYLESLSYPQLADLAIKTRLRAGVCASGNGDPRFAARLEQLSRHLRQPHGMAQRMIYLIAAGDRVKIGIAKDPSKRLASLQIGSPERLDLIATFPGSRKTEARLHERFKRYRLAGEWFRVHGHLRRFVETLGKV